MGAPDKMWLAIGLGAILLPALAYGLYLHHAVLRGMFRDEIADAVDEIADADRSRNTDASRRNLC
jgi:hypothetical protein